MSFILTVFHLPAGFGKKLGALFQRAEFVSCVTRDETNKKPTVAGLNLLLLQHLIGSSEENPCPE